MKHDPYHYGVIERAIAHIENTANAQPRLDDVAAAVGLSPAHFQRVFSQWAGVSPKKYLQYLTLNHAKSMLNDRFTVLDTALQSGLSGSGRLHDLFLSWEAMSPGEYSRKGAGLTIYYGWFETQFGPALVMGTTRGICGLAFGAEFGEQATFADMTSRWPNADFMENAERLRPWVDNILAMQGQTNLHLIGAPFQIKVWEALLTVPSGQVTTYGEIANHIGNPKAVRAVGTAVGRNPISWLIPCHRALRKSGGLGGYHWGLPVKRAMLAWESARFESDKNL
ncbi:6-O-methylguanine DNA methyltransferase [Amylibacter kogurei]|uniref:methylated-DNA--[protein]-cysteine S-methyltransferase n=1 Tax=Paramylibacter kogurei TaxID=1889778 RepID=A0A2G5K970_9RHOB|nr:bifunctional helix-turn-helix domain-containing protein/methylated-DNA--[protein]-cysteine S-methyltransferase [Amylibacter kogurei]PIB26088.1 6-O-methylguanine DNA methyltransferase [Amylibacter kogurei]